MGILSQLLGQTPARPATLVNSAIPQGGTIPGGMIPGDFLSDTDQDILPALPPHKRVASMLNRLGQDFDKQQANQFADMPSPPSMAAHRRHMQAVADQSQNLLEQLASQPGGLPSFRAEAPWGGGFGGFQGGY